LIPGSKIVSNNDPGERAPLLANQEHTGAAADSETMDRATSYLLFVFLFALFFWGWAVKNAVEQGFDLGILSFATVVVSSGYILFLHHKSGRSPGPTARKLLLASQIFVVLNYALGVPASFQLDLGVGFAIYCGVFTLLWCAIASRGRRILADEEPSPAATATTDKEKSSDEDETARNQEKSSEEEEDPSDDV